MDWCRFDNGGSNNNRYRAPCYGFVSSNCDYLIEHERERQPPRYRTKAKLLRFATRRRRTAQMHQSSATGEAHAAPDAQCARRALLCYGAKVIDAGSLRTWCRSGEEAFSFPLLSQRAAQTERHGANCIPMENGYAITATRQYQASRDRELLGRVEQTRTS